MKRIVRIFRSFAEAEEAEIREQLAMTPEERFTIARALQRRVYGPGKNIRTCRENCRVFIRSKRAIGRP